MDVLHTLQYRAIVRRQKDVRSAEGQPKYQIILIALCPLPQQGLTQFLFKQVSVYLAGQECGCAVEEGGDCEALTLCLWDTDLGLISASLSLQVCVQKAR